MSPTTILLIVLILIVIGALPTWGYHGHGYGISGAFGLLIVALLLFLLLGPRI